MTTELEALRRVMVAARKWRDWEGPKPVDERYDVWSTVHYALLDPATIRARVPLPRVPEVNAEVEQH